jgi:hypothetical protein
MAGEPTFAMYQQPWSGGAWGNKTVVDMVPPEMLHMVDAHWYGGL